MNRLLALVSSLLGSETSDRRFLVGRGLKDLVARVLGIVLVTGWTLVLARLVGAEDYGRYVYLVSALFIAGLVGGLGMPVVSGYFVERYRWRQRGLLRGFLSLALAVSVIGPAVATLALWGLVSATGGSMFAGFPIWLAAAFAIGSALVQVLASYTRALERSTLAAYNEQVVQRLVPFLLLSGAVLVGAAVTPTLALVAVTLGALLAAGVMARVVIRSVRRREPGAAPTVATGHVVRRLSPLWLHRSTTMMITPLFFIVLSETDVLMLGAFTGPTAVAIYHVARRIASMLQFFQVAVLAVGVHRFAAAHRDRDRARAQHLSDVIALASLLPALGLALIMILFGPTLLGLFGPEMVAGYTVLLILIFTSLFDSAIGPCTELLMMSGQQRIVGAINIGAGVLNIALNLALVPPFGLLGAAGATTLCVVVWKVSLAWITWRRIGVVTPIPVRAVMWLRQAVAR